MSIRPLHTLLAVERTRSNQANSLMGDAERKFGKSEYFSGHVKTLKMIADSPENAAIEQSSYDVKELPTTVIETLAYVFEHWAVAEDVIYQKNKTNQIAVADLMFRGTVLEPSVPVDELMGLEHRLTEMRKVLAGMPTLNASVKWDKVEDGRDGVWRSAAPEVTTKTDRTNDAVVLYPATDKHPAQVKEIVKDQIVGTFEKITYSGAATSLQKANALKVLDDLIVEVKEARQRANSVEIVHCSIGSKITSLVLDALK